MTNGHRLAAPHQFRAADAEISPSAARQVARLAVDGVPSHPSIGRMQNRLPTRTPSTSIGCASAPDGSIVSSNGSGMFERVEMSAKRRGCFERRNPWIRVSDSRGYL